MNGAVVPTRLGVVPTVFFFYFLNTHYSPAALAESYDEPARTPAGFNGCEVDLPSQRYVQIDGETVMCDDVVPTRVG